MFRLYDYTDATRLFGEPFESKPTPSSPAEGPGGATGESPKVIRVEGFSVQVEGDGRSILVQRDGKEVLVPLEEYKQELAERLEEQAPEIDVLRDSWVVPRRRRDCSDCSRAASPPCDSSAAWRIRTNATSMTCSQSSRSGCRPAAGQSGPPRSPTRTRRGCARCLRHRRDTHRAWRGSSNGVASRSSRPRRSSTLQKSSEAGGLRALLDGGGSARRAARRRPSASCSPRDRAVAATSP